jgi:Flp pilus assembly pilin Flp
MQAPAFLRRRRQRPPGARRRAGPRRAGQTLVEYSLILAVISILALSVFTALGNRVIYVFSAITSLLDTAQGS